MGIIESILKYAKQFSTQCNPASKHTPSEKNEERWELYYRVSDDGIYQKNNHEIKAFLEQFTIEDHWKLPIAHDLVSYQKLSILQWLHKKRMPLAGHADDGGTSLHVACGASGSLKSVKFLVENKIVTDIHKRSDRYGDTPLTLALSYEHRDIVEYFSKKFNIQSIQLQDLDIIIDRVKTNVRKWG